MSNQHKIGAATTFVIVLIVILGLYVGAYYATVCPASLIAGRYELQWDFGPCPVPPVYSFRCGPEFDGSNFSPIHWLDRRIRPRLWHALDGWKPWAKAPASGELWDPSD